MLPIAIDSTTPTNGSIVQLPLSTLTVHFNEAYAPATISTSNLTLSQGTVTGFTLVDPQTVQYALDGLVNSGTLSIGMAAGAVTDIYGNPGPAYSGTLFLNAAATAFPIPLAQLNPPGSLIYRNSLNGSILFAGNTVVYTLPVAAGQTLSAVVTPTPGLQPQVSLVGPGLNASAAAASAGAAASLQTIPITTDGNYTLIVSDSNGTTGNYSIAVYLNAAVSASASGGTPNHSLPSAQNIDGSFVALAGTRPARRRREPVASTCRPE